jgi:hypothetical protein
VQGANETKEEKTMYRRQSSLVFTALAALVLLVPLAAYSDSAKISKPLAKTTVELFNPAKLAGMPLKAGSYQVSADQLKVTLSRDGKVVAEAPVQWKDEPNKAESSAIVVDGGTITEFHFGGKARYIAVAQ